MHDNAEQLVKQAKPIGNVGQSNNNTIDLILCGDISNSFIRMSPSMLALNHDCQSSTVQCSRCHRRSIYSHGIKVSAFVTPRYKTQHSQWTVFCIHFLRFFCVPPRKKVVR